VKALTVRQPWAWAIAAAGKDVENRTWHTRYRGLLAIHAAATADSPWQLPTPDLIRAYQAGGPATGCGAVVAVARLLSTGQCQGQCSPWAVAGQYHWHLGQIRPVPEPIPATGRLGLWDLPAAAAAGLAGQGACGMRRVQVAGDLYHGQVPAQAVYVGRAAPGLPASRYASPYPAKTYGRHDAVRLYRDYLTAQPGLIEAARAELAGRDLACWCPPGQACHADVLIDLVGKPG
jgi:uncharacterized protein DUF4326